MLLFGTGCELPSAAFQGEGIRFPHLNGIVVSDKARIGSGRTLFHQVTLGIASEEDGDSAPVVLNNVTIGAGSKIIGPITIGNNVIVGANSVVTKSIPQDVTVVGANRILKRKVQQ
ncbi:serine acetyltransferase [Enorma sp. HF-1365]|uniref:Serine acetyltransferase n=1 Tax=Enorma shizhengliae TaxID=2606615 RepID=A0A7K0G9M1_9ACTN|nr:serine acetyltransferase [Enorma shizhengliae]